MYLTKSTSFYYATISLAILNVAAIYCSDSFGDLDRARSKTPAGVQARAAGEVVRRILPKKYALFKISVHTSYFKNGKDMFSIVKNNEIINIVASSGVAAVWGFHYYLKNYCGCHIGWQTKQLNIPSYLPPVNISITAKDRFRYYQNVCTTSYSFVWWGVAEWRQHIDWMALNGINIALASHGQEAIWERVYKELKLTEEEIAEHFAGPAFLSWQRMGNIRGWGGPLSPHWHKHTLILEHFVIKTMNDLGITPVLPAFAGHVPKAFKRLFPDATISPVEPWNNFKAEYCCSLYLEPTDPLFGVVGELFLTEIIREFGASHVYNSDPFNENKPRSDDPEFLKSVGAAIHQSMMKVDPDAIWLMQSWMFLHEVFYWTSQRVKSLLTSVPAGKMLILDLQSEQWPQYDRFEMYYGQPFIWCMLHNFGGTLGMFGDSQSINMDVYTARLSPNSTMVGTGLTPEGINQNYVMYDLMLESALRDSSLDVDSWVKNYTVRRYGAENGNVTKAWSILMKSVYNYTGLNKIRGKYIITRRPNLDINTWTWYSGADLIAAWKYFIDGHEVLCASSGYRHDLVDLTRQVLQYKGDQIYPFILKSFQERDMTDFEKHSDTFMDIFADLEEILSSSEDFLLGKWLEAARAAGYGKKDMKQFEYNARNQITLWGPNGEIIDYANKQWAGIVLDFFAPRWKGFLSAMYNSVINNYKFNKTAVQNAIFATVEKPFTFSTKAYPTYEIGDSIEIAKKIYSKWLWMGDFPEVPIKIIPKRGVQRSDSTYKRLLLRQQRETDDEEIEIPNNLYYNVVLSP